MLFLQEVQGVHRRHAGRYRDWPLKPQHEFIADKVWHESRLRPQCDHAPRPSRQRGAVALSHRRAGESGHFGARLRKPRSAALRAATGRGLPALHCINVHLGLFERGRHWQVRTLCERIREAVPADAPLIIAGDFNDWRRKADRTLQQELGVVEVFEAARGSRREPFPSVLPVFRLDRIYARGLRGRRDRRALRVSAGAAVGSCRACRHVRTRAPPIALKPAALGACRHESLPPRQPHHTCCATVTSISRRWTVHSMPRRTRYGSRRTSSPTIRRAASSPRA